MMVLKHASIQVHCRPRVLSPESGVMGVGIHHMEGCPCQKILCRSGHNFSPFGQLRCLKLALESTARHIKGQINLPISHRILKFYTIIFIRCTCTIWRIF